jgi:hypothetical protein
MNIKKQKHVTSRKEVQGRISNAHTVQRSKAAVLNTEYGKVDSNITVSQVIKKFPVFYSTHVQKRPQL